MVTHERTDKPAVATVAIPEDVATAVDDLVGAGRRDEFARAAIEERLDRVRAALAFIGHLSEADAPHWATEESTAEWLREIRDWPDHWADEPLDHQP